MDRATQKQPLFGSSGAKDHLLSVVLEGLSREDQIKVISDAIVANRNDIKGCEVMLDVLRKVFGEDSKSCREDREQLRKIFSSLPEKVSKGKVYSDFNREHMHRYAYAAKELKMELVRRIMDGWVWRSSGYGYDEDVRQEAEDTFEFVLQVYKEAKSDDGSAKDFQKTIVGLIRDRLGSSGKVWNLDPWILRRGIPWEIIEVMIKGRTRVGTQLVLHEITFLKPFGLHQRSHEATQIVKDLMRQIRVTEELAFEFVAKIQPKGEWKRVEDGAIVSDNGTITVRLVDETTVSVKILFHDRYFDESKCPGIATAVQEARDEVLEGIEDPPKILLEIEGPKEFSYKE